MQAPEPADEIKQKLTKDLSVSIWDRWNIDGSETITIRDVINHIETKYPGIEVRDVLHGQTTLLLYTDKVPGKQKEHAKKMNTPVFTATESDLEDEYVDLTITCIDTKSEDQVLQKTPIVRVYFKAIDK